MFHNCLDSVLSVPQGPKDSVDLHYDASEGRANDRPGPAESGVLMPPIEAA